jgi:serine/threonine protein kinase
VESANDSEARDRVGLTIDDKWTLERLIGVGGMASVYAGVHRNGARAAIKVLHRGLARHTEVRERFRREGYAANKVGHAGVVKVLDDNVIADGPEAGTAYLVMELLDGESLQDRLERGPPIGELEFLEIAYEVLAVLQAAQEVGVVHRDLKPENLFFARDPNEPNRVRIKVLDFGLARLLSEQAITTYGLALGTPSFMSPEQASGRLDKIDTRTDLFALAATGFRVRTGRRIHEGTSPVELVTKMAHLPAPPIRSVAQDVSAPFARVIDKALQFDRENRYPRAEAMRDDVRRAMAELSADDRGAAVEFPLGPPASSRRPPPPSHRPNPGPPRKSEPTIDLSEDDLEQAPGPIGLVRRPGSNDFERRSAFGLNESVRIPKNSIGGLWLILGLVTAGAAFALWRDPTHGMRWIDPVRQWASSMTTSVRSKLSPPPAPASVPAAQTVSDADGGYPMQGTTDAAAAFPFGGSKEPGAAASRSAPDAGTTHAKGVGVTPAAGAPAAPTHAKHGKRGPPKSAH